MTGTGPIGVAVAIPLIAAFATRLRTTPPLPS